MEANTLISFSNLEAVLQQYAAELKEVYKKHLVEADRLASENLINSVETQVETDRGAYLVTITLADYWKYVEEDTKPHWPPTSAILEWIRVKPVIPRPDRNTGRIPKPEQLAYLIRRAIAGQSPRQEELNNPNGGTIGSHDLALSATECNRKYEPLIAEALAQDLVAGFRSWIFEAFSYRK